jgi:hypothetical protein
VYFVIKTNYHFLGQWIEREGKENGPSKVQIFRPNSFLWGCTKEEVFPSKQGTADERLQQIPSAFATIPSDYIRTDVESASSRLQNCT